MTNQYDIVKNLTTVNPGFGLEQSLNEFAYSFGWRPSDRLEVPSLGNFSNAHLLVEHGLENSAVISFLKLPWDDIDYFNKKRLLSVSYNNLVDWHVQVQSDEVVFIFNRVDPIKIVEKKRISRDDYQFLRSDSFEKIIGTKLNPNLPTLDDALIQTISNWRRLLSAELEYSISNQSLSALFNSIIFVRAIEDNYLKTIRERTQIDFRSLLDRWRVSNSDKQLRMVIRETLNNYTQNGLPGYLLQEEDLTVFDTLDHRTVTALLTDFYQNKYYQYDFSLISQHALSKIYERYVSLLRVEPSQQLSFLPPLPSEVTNKTFGAVYTPQYLARFFARYLREQMTPGMFRKIKAIDPACGSGIFLRNLLEISAESLDRKNPDSIKTIFQNVVGYDVDANACQATRLSLSLLHLVATGNFPSTLNIEVVESINHYIENPALEESFDAVIANPPFVSLDMQEIATRETISKFMKGITTGRIDTYLAFLILGIKLLKPGGFGLFVLPHSFLMNDAAKPIRKMLSENTWIRALIDLSSIRVFEGNDIYVVLLIFQKKGESIPIPPPPTIASCNDFVGLALQDVVEERYRSTKFYQIFNINHSDFDRDSWVILPPEEENLDKKIASHPKLSDFFEVKQGIVTGADTIFIVNKNQVPKGEESIFVPFLPDREIKAYIVPEETSRYVFYPFINGEKISEDQLQTQFPNTWKYLLSNKNALQNRKTGIAQNHDWWFPTRSRQPSNILRPKIVTPHLVIVPRFAIDLEGKYLVSRSPYLYIKPLTGNDDSDGEDSIPEEDLLLFFLGVLNSTPCFWYINKHSHRYNQGYSRLEITTMLDIPVPSPQVVHYETMKKIIELVKKRILVSGLEVPDVERELDLLVANLYGLDQLDQEAMGINQSI